LSSLTIEDYNLDKEFKKEVTEYSVVVENDVKKIKINAQLDDSSAKVEGTGEVEVKEGNNKIEIKVTAEDGSTKTYVINVTVKELNPVEVTIGKKKYTIVRKEDENNKYFMYMLISLGLLAVSIITLAIVLIKQKKHKTKFD